MMMKGIEMISKSVILTDVDGVLLNYTAGFLRWATQIRHEKIKFRLNGENKTNRFCEVLDINEDQESELVREFNFSADCGNLGPWKDSVKYVRKLHEEHGYMFHAITCLGSSKKAQDARIENLKRLYGNVFLAVDFCEIGEAKDKHLSKYEGSGCWYLDDFHKHINTANKYGLECIWVPESEGSKPPTTACRIVGHLSKDRSDPWRKIYEIIA